MADEKYTQFPNSVLEALYSQRLTGMQMDVLLYICRKTFGFHREDSRISIREMAKLTGHTRPKVNNTIRDLECMGILKVSRYGSGKISRISVREPDFWDKPVSCWEQVNQPVSNREQGCAQQGTGGVPNRAQEPVPNRIQEPVPNRAHIKEKRKKKIYLKKETATSDDGSFQTKEMMGADVDTDGPEDPDGDWEDPMETLRKLREERTRDGDL